MDLNYFVIKSPFAQMIILGYKDFEFRSNSYLFKNKRLCVSVSKSKIEKNVFEEQCKIWELTEDEKEKLRFLCEKTSSGGMIIGEINTGDEAFCYEPEKGNGVKITSFSLWDESKWIKSPGGLGIRRLSI